MPADTDFKRRPQIVGQNEASRTWTRVLKHAAIAGIKDDNLRVLYLGCGGDDMVRYLAENPQLDVNNRRGYNPQVILLGIDAGRELVDIWNTINGGYFMIGDAENLPFDNDSIDVVLSYGLFDSECYPRNNHKLIVREAHRVLRPVGLLFASYQPRVTRSADWEVLHDDIGRRAYSKVIT